MIHPPEPWSWRLEWLLGAGLFGCGLYLVGWHWDAPSAPLVVVATALLLGGSLLVWVDARRALRERAFVHESARARREWQQRRQGAAAAKRAGDSIEQFVRGRDLEHDFER